MAAVTPDIDEPTDLEFKPELPCEHRQHARRHQPDGPAVWDIYVKCPKCSALFHYLLCDIGRKQFEPPHTIGCTECGHIGYWDDFIVACNPIPET